MGRVVATLTLRLPPRERGVYQASDKLVTTTGLWLWRSNARAAMEGELLRPPVHVDEAVPRARPHSRKTAPVNSPANSTLVGAPYSARRPSERDRLAPDRPPRQAHVYERRRIAHARVLVVPIPCPQPAPQTRTRSTSHTLAIWESIQRSGRTGSIRLHAFLADGEVQLDDDASVFRYCAALYPEPSQGATDTRARAHRVVDTAHAVRAGQIIFITVDENSEMAT